jgi:serine protease Do
MSQLLALAVLSLLPAQDSDPGVARRMDSPIVQVVQRALGAVVYIETDKPRTQRTIFGEFFRVQKESGSGVVVYDDGFIVTNNHVVDAATKILVRFDPSDDPRVYEAKLVAASPKDDLALLKIDGQRTFPTVPFCPTDAILGETVIAIGNPLGLSHSVSTGIVSGLHRDIQASGHEFASLIQTDAAINPGNSGGALLNVNGELLGINSAMNAAAENIGFAIPVAQVRRTLSESLLSLDQARSWLGFDVTLPGLVVRRVVPGGPAALAGIAVGDRLLAIGERALENEEGFRLARLAIRPEEDVQLEFAQAGRRRLHAWDVQRGFLFERLGFTVTQEAVGRVPVVAIAEVQPNGPASRLNLMRGDILIALKPQNGRAREIQALEDLVWIAGRVQPGTSLRLEIWRDEDGDRRYDRENEVYQGTLLVSDAR